MRERKKIIIKPSSQQYPLARIVNWHRSGLQIPMCSRPSCITCNTRWFTIIKCFCIRWHYCNYRISIGKSQIILCLKETKLNQNNQNIRFDLDVLFWQFTVLVMKCHILFLATYFFKVFNWNVCLESILKVVGKKIED